MSAAGPGARALLLALLAAASCSGGSDRVAERAARQRLADVGLERFDSAGSFRLAGVSAVRDVEIEPLDVRHLEGDTTSAGYHLLVSRCAACHAVPAPASKDAYLWSGVLSRMRHNAAEAGLLPNTREDEALLLQFLQRHAADGR